MLKPKTLSLAVLLFAVGCGAKDPAGGPIAPNGTSTETPSDSPTDTTTSSGGAAMSAARPNHPLKLAEAERYVLALVNRDRAEQKLPPVAWDDTAAKGGKAHADDMAAHGFTAHVGSDGSVPEERYSDAGGMNMVFENAGCLADASNRVIDPDPSYLPEALEKIERAFMDEVPPNDGHRRNILTAWHTHVGVGLSQTKGLDIPCMAQEFVDVYGRYDALPKQAKIGAKTSVTGELRDPAEVFAVGVARIDFPKRVRPDVLNKAHSYSIPQPQAIYFPKGFKTPIPLAVNGRAFSIEVPLSDGGRPGLYEVSVWAKLPQTKDGVMVSLRTIEVR